MKRFISIYLLALTYCLLMPGKSLALQQQTEVVYAHLIEQVDVQLEQVRDEMIAFRRDLHQHPEVSGQEKRTASAIANRLKALNLEVRQQVGGYGVVAFLEGGQPGPTVAFRADMDAVFSNAPDPVEYASKVPGVRHICGHDIHTAVGVALAEGLASIQAELQGSVLLLFQPAEENVRGARAMLEEGVFSRRKPEAIFAYHTAPFEVGQIGTKPGAMLAGRDNLIVELQGEEGLAEAGEAVKEVIESLNTLEPGQMSVTGDFFSPGNVRTRMQSDENSMRVFTTVTTTSDALREKAKSAVNEKLRALESDGFSTTMKYIEIVAGVNNDMTLEVAARRPMHHVIGEENLVVINTVPTPFSEDFGFFQQQVPGVMYFLGVSNAEKGWVGQPHSPDYVADDEAIFVGAKAMAAVMLDFMASSL